MAEKPPVGWDVLVIDETDAATFEREMLNTDVLLHVPLVDSTRELIRAENIAMMKDGAVLINTVRGGLVNEADLFDALKRGKLLGAGLDVLNQEPNASALHV